jgi:hypothetical protein
MIFTLINWYLDYFIININQQHLIDIEKIREELHKEFEWEGPPLSLIGLKKSSRSFMKQEKARLK